MSAATKRNATPEGCGRGAKQKARQTRSDYRTDAAASTGATIEAAPVARDKRPFLSSNRTEWDMQVTRHKDTTLCSLRIARELVLASDKQGRVGRTYASLGAPYGYCERQVGRAVKALSDAGHLVIMRRGGAGHSSLVQLVIKDADETGAGQNNRTSMSGYAGDDNRTFWVAKPDIPSQITGHSGAITGHSGAREAENQSKINGPEKPLINKISKSIDAALKGCTSTISDTTESCTSDAPAYAPEGATASDACIDPDLSASEEIPDQHAEAARPPVEDDDYIPFHLADEDEEPDRPHDLPVAITETERTALEAIYDSTVRGRNDGFQHWAELPCADPFDDGGATFKAAVSALVAARLAFHEDGFVTITRRGEEALGAAKPIAHKPVITDDDFIPF